MKEKILGLCICIFLSLFILSCQKNTSIQQKAGTVTVLGVWGGQELEIFQEMVKPFEESTGIKVEYEGTRDIDAVLTTRVTAGNPPDIAGLPGPGKMKEFASQGKLVDLSQVLDMPQVKKDYVQSWLDMATVNGKLAGVFIKAALKGIVWYNPKNLNQAGLQVPATWEDMIAASRTLIKQGQAPWAIGVESGAASGWTGTDWLENIFLHAFGPEKYREWYEGKLSWTSAEMKKTWQTWGQIVADPKMIYGGKAYALSTNFGQAFEALFTQPPRAGFHHQASFIQSFIKEKFPALEAGRDYTFFNFPSIDDRYAKAIETSGDIAVMFNDTPQARALMRYMATTQAQAFWTSGSGALSPNRNVSLVFYPDELSKTAAKIANNAEVVVFDASDMMPGEMNNAFWSAVLQYLENPENLDGILDELEQTRQKAYN